MAVPTPVTIPSRLSDTPVPFTFAAAPITETEFDWMPGDILLVFNSSADTGYTYTITSDPTISREDTVITAKAIAFGVYHVCPRFSAQEGGKLNCHASNAAVKFARLSTRAQPS